MTDRREQFREELEALCLKHDLIFWDIGDGRSYGVVSREQLFEAAGNDHVKAMDMLILDPNWKTLRIPAGRAIPTE